MKDLIQAIIKEDHFWYCKEDVIARKGEGLYPCLSITIPDFLYDCWAYLDFKKPNGDTFKTPRLEVEGGKIIYDIPSSVLDMQGDISVQAVFQNPDGGIWKSYVKRYAVRNSINAVDDIPEQGDFINEAQKLLDELEGAVPTAKVEQTADGATITVTDSNGTTTATIKNGENGEKGEKGDPCTDGVFGATVKIVGGEKETDTGRVEVGRDFETYGAMNRKFATYDYNGFLAKDKLVNGKPLFVCTNVWQQLQLNAYSNHNVATEDITKDYQENTDKYYDDGDCIRRDINIHYPMKDGQVAIIEKGGILRVYNIESENVNTGATKTAWVIFENDGGTEDSYNRMYNDFWKLKKVTSIEAPKANATFKKVTAGETKTGWVIFENDTPQLPNRMFNDTWQLLQVYEIFAGNADTWFKNVHTQSVYTPWVVFDNDGGTEATYNRLYDEWWKLNKLQSIYAPVADASFKSVKANGVDLAKELEDIKKEIAKLKTLL